MSKTISRDEHDGYDRTAGRMDAAESWLEALTFIDSLRRRAWSLAKGPLVLEIGIGSGRSLRYHPPGARIVAFDFSPSMLKRAIARAAANGSDLDLLLADVNYLPFKSAVFDTVLSTFVFCMPPDPVAALAEAKRACQPDGQVVLLEHVRPANPLLGKAADILNRFSSRGGEYVNRDTAANVRKAGLSIAQEDRHRMGIVKLLRAHPPAASTKGEPDVVAS